MDRGAYEELAAAFAADGVVCVRGVLDPREVATAAQGIGKVLASPGPFAVVASAADDPGAFTEDFAGGRTSPRSGSWPGIRAPRRSPRR
jgi:hypothetical protein